jgi:phage/plasmid-like protein (TIGR03299 family)
VAHNLNFKNGKASMFYVNEVPWHKVGTKLDKPATAEEAIKAAQLNYHVSKQPLYRHDGDGYISVSGIFVTVREDTNTALGKVGTDYKVVQNSEAFCFFDSLVGEGEAIYETAGALGKGERIWILAKLPEYIKLNNEDIINKYLLLYNSHDGSSSIKAKLTPIRVVCNNTLSFALNDRKEKEISVRHTRNVEAKLKEAHKLLGLTNVIYSNLEEIFNKMTLRKIAGSELVGYVKTLIPDNPEALHNTKTENIRETIYKLYDQNELEPTVYKAYNTITEYVDHTMSTSALTGPKNLYNKKLKSMWFGSGELLKQKAFKLATEILN